MQQYRHNKAITAIMLAAFLLQAMIPAGYMPGSVADGKFVELCPSGLSAGAMSALSGEHHHHHADSHVDFSQCDLGGGLSAPALLAQATLTYAALPGLVVLRYVVDQRIASAPSGVGYQPRSPPKSTGGVRVRPKRVV